LGLESLPNFVDPADLVFAMPVYQLLFIINQ